MYVIITDQIRLVMLSQTEALVVDLQIRVMFHDFDEARSCE
jgi:hypothetical protein